MSTKRFPVITGQSRLPQAIRARWPRSVPWTFVEPHRAQIQSNHDQTLERLAQRGGLAPDELWLAAHAQPLSRYRQNIEPPSEEVCGEWLIAEMAKLGEGPS
jgi:hypothetical protein